MKIISYELAQGTVTVPMVGDVLTLNSNQYETHTVISRESGRLARLGTIDDHIWCYTVRNAKVDCLLPPNKHWERGWTINGKPIVTEPAEVRVGQGFRTISLGNMCIRTSKTECFSLMNYRKFDFDFPKSDAQPLVSLTVQNEPLLPKVGERWKYKDCNSEFIRIDDDQGRKALGYDHVQYHVSCSEGRIVWSPPDMMGNIIILSPRELVPGTLVRDRCGDPCIWIGDGEMLDPACENRFIWSGAGAKSTPDTITWNW